MDVKRKLFLLKTYESYWLMLPSEIQEYVVVFKISQQLIDERNREQTVMLRREILVYHELKEKWGLGPIGCKVYKCSTCTRKSIVPEASHVKILGFYCDIDNVKQSKLLGYGYSQALSRINHVKSLL